MPFVARTLTRLHDGRRLALLSTRWFVTITPEDCDRLMDLVRAVRADHDDAVTYVALLGHDAHAPDEAVRRALKRLMAELDESLAAVHLVVPPGVKGTGIRLMLAGLRLVFGQAGRKLFVHATVQECATALTKQGFASALDGEELPAAGATR